MADYTIEPPDPAAKYTIEPPSKALAAETAIPRAYDVAAPVANMLIADPIRNLAADVVGMAKGGLPIDPASRQAFQRAREQSLSESERYARLPETASGQRIGRALGLPGQYIGAGIERAANWAMGRENAATLAPWARMGVDALPFAGAKLAGPALTRRLEAAPAVRAGENAFAEGAARAAGQVAASPGEALSQTIRDTYNSAIRPTVVGKATAPRREAAEAHFENATRDIAANKGDLILQDRKGREVVGRVPYTLDEFSQAIAQRKEPAFAVYDGMARQAEAAGAMIDTAPVAAELEKFASADGVPLSLGEFARKQAAEWKLGGLMTPTAAQATVKSLNQGLTSFYGSASQKTIGQTGVEALIANALRHQLDGTLERSGIPGYQEARNVLASLKAIEGEVAHRAVVYGRRDPGGGLVGRLGTVASAEELVRFATHLDPTALATSAAIKGSKAWNDWFRGPNRAVKNMFKAIERLDAEGGSAAAKPPPGPTTGGMQPPRPTGKGQEVYSGPTTPESALQQRGGSVGTGPYRNTPNLRGHRPVNPDDPIFRALDY